MPLTPPQAAQPGQPYYLQFVFTDSESGALVDPVTLQLDITYGTTVGATPDAAGPFTYSGASSPAPGTVWRTGTGLYTAWWQVPESGIGPGVYSAAWTSTYGADLDTFIAYEDFPLLLGGPFMPVPSGDIGYWTGSLTYSPPWAPNPFVITFGETDGNGITWTWQKLDGWDGPPTVGSVTQRSADHGGYPAAQFYGSRIMTLTVMASAPTEALRDVARAQLGQVVAVGMTSTDLTTMVYSEPVPKQALVRLNGSAKITEACPTLTDVVFTIPLVAPDMRKYATQPGNVQILVPTPISAPLTLPFSSGLPVAFPGGILPGASTTTVTNSGTFETRPQLTVTGPIVNPAVVNVTLGQTVSFTGLTMAATDVLTIDMDNRQPFLNRSFYPADPGSQWWTLQPGTSSIYLGGVSTGGAGLQIVWSSAWL